MKVPEPYESTEEYSWSIVEPEDIWIFDKLALAKRLGYICGPVGIDVPSPDYYLVRPCVNAKGLGEGAEVRYIRDITDHLPAGYFWCEVFKGDHLSVDFYKGDLDLVVKGVRSSTRGIVEDLSRWDKWVKLDLEVEFPKILKCLKGSYDWINIEMIGGNIIEVHLRRNPDFQGHESDYVRPVYSKGDFRRENELFIERNDGNRLGFYIQDKKEFT